MLKSGVTLYFIRHGETDWNRDGRYQGQSDIPLNATGRAQAARNGRTLASIVGDRRNGLDYVASPLVRSAETMTIVRREIGLRPDDYRTDPRLMEVHYGDWEGRSPAELAIFDPEGFAARSRDAWMWNPRGGESYQAMSQRIARWLGEIERNAVVVAHSGVARVLLGLIQELPTAEVPFLETPQDRVLLIEATSIRWL